MTNDLLYQIALTQIPLIGCVHAKVLAEEFGSAEAIFKASQKMLEKVEGIGQQKAENIKAFQHFSEAEKEVAFIEKYKIQPLFITDDAYPKRLLNCYDSPTLLYYRGTANVNEARIVAIIGTRSHTDYGKAMTEKLVAELAAEKILIISGLAYGIDTVAHKAAIQNSLPTIGVLAHGLDTLYPSANARLAKEMVAEGGGLLTEFRSGTKPDKHNFPTRNRIVAGLADATIVIETDLKGGSMITAELANNYNRDVFALPGKVTDARSRGCNHLIKTNKAALFTSGTDLLEIMNWLPQPSAKKRVQRQLFVELTIDERTIVNLLTENEALPIDELYLQSNLSTSTVAGVLLSLELQGLVQSMPGKMYKLV
jgi:DNA processing protein